jgi:hypothetical protein
LRWRKDIARRNGSKSRVAGANCSGREEVGGKDDPARDAGPRVAADDGDRLSGMGCDSPGDVVGHGRIDAQLTPRQKPLLNFGGVQRGFSFLEDCGSITRKIADCAGLELGTVWTRSCSPGVRGFGEG